MSLSSPVSIYYLASGEIGVPVLDALRSDTRLRLVGMGTQPDRPAGRKRVPVPTPVGEAAASRGLAMDKVPSVNAEAFLGRLSGLGVELVVVASFGQLLKEPLLRLPSHGCLNVHASLLPRHRGASPIAAAILAGDGETGVSFMEMERGLDTGPVYEMHRLPIRPDDTSRSLEARLGDVAAARVGDCIVRVVREGLTPTAQPEAGVTYARRLHKQDGQIDWRHSAVAIERMVRAFLPWPTAFTSVPVSKGDIRIQVVSAAVSAAAGNAGSPGKVIKASSSEWVVACGEGALTIRRVVPSGRREMSAEEFLRGSPVPEGTRLGTPASEGDIGVQ